MFAEGVCWAIFGRGWQALFVIPVAVVTPRQWVSAPSSERENITVEKLSFEVNGNHLMIACEIANTRHTPKKKNSFSHRGTGNSQEVMCVTVTKSHSLFWNHLPWINTTYYLSVSAMWKGPLMFLDLGLGIAIPWKLISSYCWTLIFQLAHLPPFYPQLLVSISPWTCFRQPDAHSSYYPTSTRNYSDFFLG